MKNSNARQSKADPYSLFFTSNPHPMLIYELKTLKILAVNNAMVRKYGYSRKELSTMTIKDIRPKEDIPRLLENISRVTEGLDEAGAWRHRTKQGEVIEVEIISHTVIYQGKKCEVVLAHDVTQRNIIQKQLLQTQQQLLAIVEHASDWIWEINMEGVITFSNRKVKEILGYEPEEIIGKTASLFTPSDEIARVTQIFLNAAENKAPVIALENVNLHKSGARVTVETSAVPILDEQGNVIGYRGIDRDITARKNVEDHCARLSLFDPLTNLPNRLLFIDRMNQLIRLRKKKAKKYFGVLFIDLHHFKILNDTLGYQLGNQAIRTIATMLQQVIQSEDTVARIHGDEFAVLLCNISARQTVAKTASAIHKLLSKPVRLNDHMVSLAVDIGAVIGSSDDVADELLRKASVAMYYAQRNTPRSKIVFYTEQLDRQILDTQQIEHRLPSAIPQKELFIHYQPIAAAQSQKIIGFEALLRWHHPTMGYVSPSQFIPLAEETGQIYALGKWVFEQANKQLYQWNTGRPKKDHRWMSVNVSAQQFLHPTLQKDLLQIIRRYHTRPEWFVLEITETSLLKNPRLVKSVLQQLRSHGFRIALDDFGSGFSSLQTLCDFPIDIIKIDHSFVQQMASNRKCTHIIRTITNIAHRMKMSVIAEGAEDKKQYSRLQKQGCDAVQGFYVSPPRPAQELNYMFG